MLERKKPEKGDLRYDATYISYEKTGLFSFHKGRTVRILQQYDGFEWVTVKDHHNEMVSL